MNSEFIEKNHLNVYDNEFKNKNLNLILVLGVLFMFSALYIYISKKLQEDDDYCDEKANKVKKYKISQIMNFYVTYDHNNGNNKDYYKFYDKIIFYFTIFIFSYCGIMEFLIVINKNVQTNDRISFINYLLYHLSLVFLNIIFIFSLKNLNTIYDFKSNYNCSDYKYNSYEKWLISFYIAITMIFYSLEEYSLYNKVMLFFNGFVTLIVGMYFVHISNLYTMFLKYKENTMNSNLIKIKIEELQSFCIPICIINLIKGFLMIILAFHVDFINKNIFNFISLIFGTYICCLILYNSKNNFLIIENEAIINTEISEEQINGYQQI